MFCSTSRRWISRAGAAASQLLEEAVVEHRVVTRGNFQIERLGVAHQQHAAHVVRMLVEIADATDRRAAGRRARLADRRSSASSPSVPEVIKTRFETSPRTKNTCKGTRHQRASLQVEPMPASRAATGKIGVQKRSIRCVNSHQARNTRPKYAASHQVQRRRGPTKANAARGTSSGLSQSLLSVTPAARDGQVGQIEIGRSVRSSPLRVVVDRARAAVEHAVHQRVHRIAG